MSDPHSQPYLTHPAASLVEGEIELAPDAPSPDELLLAFVHRLLAEAVQAEDAHGPSPEWSSLTMQPVANLSTLSGRIYGQAWAERRGQTVHFLRVRLYDAQGEVVLTGMATSHTPT